MENQNQLNEILKKVEQFGKNIQKGDLKISKLIEYGFVLYGDSKTGKTASSHLMIGNKLQVTQLYGQYVIKNPEKNPYQQARIGNHENSQTMIPNFFEVQVKDALLKGKKVLLIDTPGYSDSNGTIRIIANGYFHYKLYSRIQNMKFIICVDRDDLNKKAQKFIETLHEFTSSFKNYVQQKQIIWQSCVLVFTKVQQTLGVINQLKQKLLRISQHSSIELDKAQQTAMRQMIKYLVQKNRIFYIKKYKNGQTPHLPQLLDQINERIPKWYTRKIIKQKGIVDMQPIRFSLISKLNSLGSGKKTSKQQLIQLINYYNLRIRAFVPQNLRSNQAKNGTICQVLQQIMSDFMKSTDSRQFINLMKKYVECQYKKFDPSLESVRKQVQKQLFSFKYEQTNESLNTNNLNKNNQIHAKKGKILNNEFHYTIKKYKFIIDSYQTMQTQGNKQNQKDQKGLQSYKNALCQIFKKFNQISYLYQDREQIIYKYCYIIYRIVQECKIFYHLIEQSSTQQEKKTFKSLTNGSKNEKLSIKQKNDMSNNNQQKVFIELFYPLKYFMDWQPQFQGSKPLSIKQKFLRNYNPDQKTLQSTVVDQLVIQFLTDPEQVQKCKDCNRLKLTISKLLVRYSIQILSSNEIKDKTIFGKLISRLSKFRLNCEQVYNSANDDQKKQALIIIRKITVQLGKMLQKLVKIKQAITVYKTINCISQVCRLYEKLISQADKLKQRNRYPQNSVTQRIEYALYLQEHFMQQKAIIVIQDAYEKSESMQNVQKGYQLLDKLYQAQQSNDIPQKRYENQLSNKKFFEPFQKDLQKLLEDYAQLK